jgi:glutathione S-transferase
LSGAITEGVEDAEETEPIEDGRSRVAWKLAGSWISVDWTFPPTTPFLYGQRNRRSRMLTLYHAPQSRSSRIVWLLEELGADYALKITDIPRMDGKGAPDPTNPHPDKKVPALVDDGVLITESIAIVQYLTDMFPAADIGPRTGDAKRGPYLSWLAYYAGVIEPVVNLEFAGLADNAAMQRTFRNRASMDRHILAALEAGPYLLGDKFSGADILIASMGQWARTMLPAGDVVDSYLGLCNSRPALARARAKDGGN